jgi:Carbohydrate family 9 binding domain-like
MARLAKMYCVRRQVFACAAMVCVVLGIPCLGLQMGNSSPNQPAAKAEMHHPVIVSTFSPRDIRPDGELNKPFWLTARRVSFDQAGFTRTPYPQSETRLASRWTREYLYLAFWCHYQSLNIFNGEDPKAERWGLWDKDVVEAFIAPDPARPSNYFEFEVAPNNQWIDLEIDLTRRPFNNAQWNSGFEHATRIDTGRHVWTSEWRIPLTALTRPGISPEGVWRINFYRSDGAAPHRRDMSWGALPRQLPQSSFHQPDSFGILRFANQRATKEAH